MSDRQRLTHQIIIPPPLPKHLDEHERPAALLAAIVLAGLLLLLLILFILYGRSSHQSSSTASNGDQSSNNAEARSSDAAAKYKSDIGMPSGLEYQQRVRESFATSENNTRTEQIANSQTVSSSTGSAPSAICTGQSDKDVVSQNGAEIEINELPGGNQFFTLGETAKRDQQAIQNQIADSQTSPTREALAGRSGDKKERLLRDYGGTAATEASVKLGLEWLARNQQENGLWSLTGPYSDASSTMENTAAATALALLAFQGAGHTHKGDPNEPFTRVVARGANALLRYVPGKGNVTNFSNQFGGYGPALCTIAICELYGMTHDRQLRAPALQAVNFCLDAQSPQGGWRYVPKSDSDTSVTGWFVMGLQSARMAGLKVPNEVFDRVSIYLDAAANTSGTRYGYQPGLAPTRSMTAEALLCRQYLGWYRDKPQLQDGVQYLLSQLPDWDAGRDVYYLYYATQVCHHMGGAQWQKWNGITRELLPSKQIKDGPERGSWDPRGDRWGSQGGRLYVTCLSLCILEVYYRYLPLYQELDD